MKVAADKGNTRAKERIALASIVSLGDKNLSSSFMLTPQLHQLL